jgi:RNA polymerase sigma factor (TIGR02999 family)
MDSSRHTETGAPVEQALGTVQEIGSPALDALFTSAYAELCELASAQRRRWRGHETLDTTALVHELYLKLARQQQPPRNPPCLYSVAAKAMRHLLVNYAEQQRALKRGGEARKVPLATLSLPAGDATADTDTADQVLALNEALDRLASLSTRQRDVVECRFFGQLSVEETADALGISTATVKRDWRLARAWLRHELRLSWLA